MSERKKNEIIGQLMKEIDLKNEEIGRIKLQMIRLTQDI